MLNNYKSIYTHAYVNISKNKFGNNGNSCTLEQHEG